MTVGRNDPCPCGSGKKYKKCCQPRQEVISLAAVRTDNLFRDLWEKFSKHMGREETSEEVAKGFARFFVIPMDDEDTEEAEEIAEWAKDWVAFAYRTDDGTTLCERVAKQGKGFSDQEREVLRTWAESAPGFFRVEGVTGDEYHLHRLPDGKAFTVRAPAMTLEPGDLISAWLLPVLSTYRFGYLVQDIGAEAVDPLMHLVDIEMALLQSQRPGGSWDELYREHWPRLSDAFALAVTRGEDVLRIPRQSGPSVRWEGDEPPYESSKVEEVGLLVQQALISMDDTFLPDDIAGAVRFWKDAVLTLRPRIVRPESWAAGVIYTFLTHVLEEETTQTDVAEELQVSVSTVGARSRELVAALDPAWLDPRYVWLMSPYIRMQWQQYWVQTLQTDEELSSMALGQEQGPLEQVMRLLEQSRRPERTGGPILQAEELLDQAWEASGVQRTRLAEKALKLWPDAADAYVMLGQAAEARGRLQEALKLFEAGVQAGERALGPDFFAENVGDFYGLVESRPYMRARAGAAGCLWALGKRDEALAHYTEMLRLNPGDNQGIRYLLAECYLSMGDDARLGRHLAEHADDPMAAMVFTRALWEFRRSGPGKKADALLREAMAENPHVADYLLGNKLLPAEPPAYLDYGGELEAVGYAWSFGQGWRQTPGALDWLRHCMS